MKWGQGSGQSQSAAVTQPRLRAGEEQHPDHKRQLRQEECPELARRHHARAAAAAAAVHVCQCRRVQLQIAAVAGPVRGGSLTAAARGAGRVEQAAGVAGRAKRQRGRRQPCTLAAVVAAAVQALLAPGAEGGAVEGRVVAAAGAAAAGGGPRHPAGGVPPFVARQLRRLWVRQGWHGAGRGSRCGFSTWAPKPSCLGPDPSTPAPQLPVHLVHHQCVALSPVLAAQVVGQRVDGKNTAAPQERECHSRGYGQRAESWRDAVTATRAGAAHCVARWHAQPPAPLPEHLRSSATMMNCFTLAKYTPRPAVGGSGCRRQRQIGRCTDGSTASTTQYLFRWHATSIPTSACPRPPVHASPIFCGEAQREKGRAEEATGTPYWSRSMCCSCSAWRCRNAAVLRAGG